MLKKLLIVAVYLVSCIISGGWFHGSPWSLPNGGDVLMGLGPQAYYTNGPAFLNWAVAGGINSYGINLTSGTMDLQSAYTNGVIDSNGELIAGAGLSSVASISKAIFTPTPSASSIPVLANSPWWSGLSMKITWTGASTVTQTGTLGTGGTALSCGANFCTFTFGSNPTNVGFNFAITDINNPPKNIFVYEVKYQTQITALSTCNQLTNCNHFRPIWLSTIASFGRLRFMDWMAVNTSGEFDTSAMADWNYQICIACNYSGIGMGNASIAGTKLTVSSVGAGSTIGIGETVNGQGVTQVTIIGSAVSNSGACSPACTGNGTTGTYALSGSSQTIASENMFFSATTGYSGQSGPKGGIHPVIATELARLTGADIYFNLPVNITDVGFQNVANYFAANLPPKIKWFAELGNENWNFGLGVTYYWLNAAAVPIFGGTANGVLYAGYRMSQLMAMNQAIFGTDSYNAFSNTNSRWGGIIGGQMVSTTVTETNFLAGFTQWQTTYSPTTLPANLFSESVVAPYFSDFPTSLQITGVTPGTTTTVATSGGTYSTGEVVRLFFGNTGAGSVGSALNKQNVTLTSGGSGTFSFSNISTSGLTYTSAGANDFTATDSNGASGGSQTVAPLYATAGASVACAAASSATATATMSGNSVSLSGISGTVVIGMGMTGSGIPANTYLWSGSGSSWTSNTSASIGPVSVALSPCPDEYQYFAQEASKALITGSAGDLGYLPSITQASFNSTLKTHLLLANSYGLGLSQYEGGNQFICSGQMCASGGDGDVGNLFINWQWSDGGNDANYTPAKVYQNQFSMMRSLYLPYSGKYVEQYQGSSFSGVRYLGDINPSWSAILAENASGFPVDPTTPATWTASYPGNGTNCASGANRCFTNSSCSSCTDTFTPTVGALSGKIIVMALLSGGTLLPTSVTCNGVALNPDTSSIGSRAAAIYSGALGSGLGTTTCSVVYTGTGQNFQNREYYAATVTGLNSTATLAVQPGNVASTFTINYTKGGLLVAAAACSQVASPFGNTSGVSTPSASSPITSSIAMDSDTTSGRTAMFGLFNAPFSSQIFSVAPGCNFASVAAVYR